MGNCPCSSKSNVVPHSDLFVPQFDVTVNAPHSKKLMRLKSLKQLSEMHKMKEVSTEKFIRAKALFRNTIASSKKGMGLSKEIHRAQENISLMNSQSIPQKLAKSLIVNTNSAVDNDETNETNNNKESTTKDTISHTVVGVNKIGSTAGNTANHSVTFKDGNNNNNQKATNNLDSQKGKKRESNTELATSMKTMQCEVSEQLFSSNEEIYIANVLLHHYLFHKATNVVLNYLFSEINEFQIEKDAPIFYEGDEGTCLFIVKKGQVELSMKNSNLKYIISEGEIFGELALLKEGIKRTYTARSITYLEFYIIDINAFKEVADKLLTKNTFTFSIFDYIDSESRDSILLLSAELDFKKGSSVKDMNGIFGIEYGNLSLSDVNGKEIEQYKKGEIFGINNILCDINKEDKGKERKLSRTSTMNQTTNKLVVNENTQCSVIPTMGFIEVFGIDYKEALTRMVYQGMIERNIVFCNLINDSNKEQILSMFELKEYKRNEMIHPISLKDNKIKLVLYGKVLNAKGNNSNELVKDATGTIIGEDLFNGKKKKEEVLIDSAKVVCFECDWSKLKMNININGMNLHYLVNKLKDLHFFFNVPESKIIQFARGFKMEKWYKNQIVIQEGKRTDKVFYISKGNFKLLINKSKERNYSKGNSFGEISILHGKEQKYEIVCLSDNSELFTINRNDFFNMMSDPLLNTKTRNKICLEDFEIFPSALYYLSTLYKGNNSNIYLAHNKISLYVIKAIYVGDISKGKISDKMVKKLVNEKKISKRLNHPFLIHYVKTLKNNQWCFFIEEYIHGITLQEYIEMCKPYHDDTLIKFYSACLFTILHILSSCGIIHRDIKPANIMISTKGYLKLIDFSSSKVIKSHRTKTMIGTPLFTAPEILNGKGYAFAVDYWSVGVVLYYLYYGQYPFGGNSKQPDAVYKEILNKKLTFEKESNPLIEELLEGLLKKNEGERICTYKQIEKCSLFKDFEWDKLYHMELKAPFLPQVVKISKEKMLKDVTKKFNDFIASEKVDKMNVQGKLDKDVVMSSVEDNGNDNHTKVNETNWFDIF